MTTNTDVAMPELPVVAWLYQCWTTAHVLNHQNDHYFSVDDGETKVKGEPLVRLSDARAAIQQAAGAVPKPRRVTIADARDYLNTNDKAFWVTGWNECVEELLAGREAGISDHSVPCAGGGVTQPLTEARIEEIARPFIKLVGGHWDYEDAIRDNGDIEDFARAIEAAHGIVEPARGNDAATGQIKMVVNDKLPDDVVVFMQEGKEVGRIVNITPANPASADKEKS